MARVATSFAIVSVALLFTSCMPAVIVRMPALQGRVVDVQGKPIPDATLIVEMKQGSTEVARFKAGKDGQFSRPEESIWWIYFAGFDFVRMDYVLRATGNGSVSAGKDFSNREAYFLWGLGERQVETFGDIRLP